MNFKKDADLCGGAGYVQHCGYYLFFAQGVAGSMFINIIHQSSTFKADCVKSARLIMASAHHSWNVSSEEAGCAQRVCVCVLASQHCEVVVFITITDCFIMQDNMLRFCFNVRRFWQRLVGFITLLYSTLHRDVQFAGIPVTAVRTAI